MACLLFVACSRSGSSDPAGVAAANEGRPRPSASPQASCQQVTGCIQACPPAKLVECSTGCKTTLAPSARPIYDALEACSKPACADSCKEPTAFGCKLCVMSHCASQVAACMSH